jgi:hypothetical protein
MVISPSSHGVTIDFAFDAGRRWKERQMARVRKLTLSSLLVVVVLLMGAAPALASNVCPVTGGPNDPTIKSTPAEVPDKSGNPAHGEDPTNPQPGDAFWN